MKLNEMICMKGLIIQAQSEPHSVLTKALAAPVSCMLYYPAFCAGGPAVDYSSHILKMCRVFSLFVAGETGGYLLFPQPVSRGLLAFSL